jgi:hypothetical protein
VTRPLLPLARRRLQQLGELSLPEARLAGGAVAGGLVVRGNQEHAAVLHPLDLPVEQPELGRVALVVRRVDRQQRRLDALQVGGGVVVAGGVPLVEVIVGVTAERRAQALVEELSFWSRWFPPLVARP